MKITDTLPYEQIFNSLPFGLILVGQDRSLYAWNQWLEANTKINAKEVLGKPLESVKGIVLSFRFNFALEQVLKYGLPQVLSSALNEFVLPVPINKGPFGELDKMQQEVHVLPIDYQDQKMALITIKDVSHKIYLKNTLMAIAAKFEKSSFIDMLTGCYNRRFLFKYLETQLKIAKRKKYNIFCCLLDLDHFKKINDELGHDAGDEVLIGFAKLVQSIIRPSDYFFRYGGEEFIIISSDVSLDEAILISNRIRKELEGSKLLKSVNKTLTCSAGLSYWKPTDPAITAEQLISLADKQLYQAKAAGRNCIRVDDESV